MLNNTLGGIVHLPAGKNPSMVIISSSVEA